MKKSSGSSAGWVLASIFGLLRRHKKKTALLIFVAICYAAWRNRSKLPYQKIASKVMEKIAKVMNQQMQHQQFVQENNEILLNAINSVDQNRLILNLNLKYSNLFTFEALRNQLKLGAKTLSGEEKVKLWQNIIDELIYFTFFTLIVTRQTITLHTIRHVIVGKYRNDFYSLLKDSSSVGIGLLNDVLHQACDDIIQSSLQPTLDFMRGQISHDIKPTSQMNYYETAAVLKKISLSLFSSKSQKCKDVHAKAHLTSNKDRSVENIFLSPKDPSFSSPSIFTRIFELGRAVGQRILPNMYPDSLRLCPPDSGFTLLSSIFSLNQQESISDMNSNLIITRVFLAYSNRIKLLSEKPHDDDEEEEKRNFSDSLDISQHNEQLVKEKKKPTAEEDDRAQRIEKGKVLCSLALKELRDVLATTSMHNQFYFSCMLDLRRFLNRLLLLLEKRNELNQKQAFAKISSYFDKVISEEMLGDDAEKHNQEFYEVRIKRCFNLIKAAKQDKPAIGESEQKEAPGAIMSESTKDNSVIFNSTELKNQPPNTTTDLLIHLNILQEIEQSNLIEDALKELTKRIYFERDQTTIEIDTPPQKQQAADSNESPLDLMSLLSGGNPGGQGGGGGGDLMSLLSKI